MCAASGHGRLAHLAAATLLRTFSAGAAAGDLAAAIALAARAALQFDRDQRPFADDDDDDDDIGGGNDGIGVWSGAGAGGADGAGEGAECAAKGAPEGATRAGSGGGGDPVCEALTALRATCAPGSALAGQWAAAAALLLPLR